jgi:hypothetical protein
MIAPVTTRTHAAGLTLRCALLALAFIGSSTPAQANTYLFSFTTSQILTALQTAQGTAVYDESAYFAIFLQPNPAQVTNYTYSSVTSPNPTDTNAWVTNTITDPASPYFGYNNQTCTANCTWAYFEKAPTATAVTLVSGANGGSGGRNIFLNGDFSSNSPPPYGWGTTDALINAIMPGSDAFQFAITTNLTLSGDFTILGRASSIKSGSASSMTLDTKENDGIAFTLTATQGVPEPGTWSMLAIGGALLGLARLRVRRRQP